MHIDLIAEDNVRHALGRILAADDLAGNPLLGLNVVAERLRGGDTLPTEATCAWSLTSLLIEVVNAELARLRGATWQSATPRAAEPPPAATAIRRDFQVASADLEAWSCLYQRYLSPLPMQVQELAALIQPGAVHGRRFVSRRLDRGYKLLANVLRQMETAANQRSPAAADRPPETAPVPAVGVARPAPAAPSRLPQWRTTFVGRDADVAGLVAALPPGKLVTLVGPPGVGKTRLAVAVAGALGDRCPDGTAFVELSTVADPELVGPVIRQQLEVRETPGQSVAEDLADALAGRRLLLILDNCEHVRSACAELVDGLLYACPDLRVIATSRERLNVEGERLWRVQGLASPQPHEVDSAGQLTQWAAIRLFVERAQAVDQRFQLTDENARAVVAICRKLDGMPLALELIAARVGAMPVTEMAGRLDAALSTMAGGQRKPGRRAETLCDTVQWSYRLLAPPQQALFARLGAFFGGWQLEAAEAVCANGALARGEVVGHLASLGDKSLLIAESRAEGVRYRFLEPIAQCARQLLDCRPEAPEVRDRLLAWCTELAEAAEPALKGAEQAQWLERLTVEEDNLRAALRWACERPAPAAAVRLAGALWHYWQMRGLVSEGRYYLEQVLSLAADGPPVPDCQLARALEGAGTLASLQADYPSAQRHLAAALAIRRDLSVDADVAELVRRLGTVADERGAHDEALDLFRQSLATYRSLGDRRGTAAALNSLGLGLYHYGHCEEARPLLEESLGLFRDIGEDWAASIALLNLGNVACDQGDLAAALSFYGESLAIARRLDDRTGVANSLNGLAHIAVLDRRLDQAEALLRENYAILREQDDRYGLAEWLDFVAALHEADGRAERAVWVMAVSEGLRQELDVPLPRKEQALREARLAVLRTRLGEAAFDAAWAAGRAPDWRDAVREAARM